MCQPLQSANAKTNTIVVSSRDTDVLCLLVAHCDKSIGSSDLWMKSGTYKQPKCIPVKEIIHKHQLDVTGAQLLLAFHAITGCDSTSYLSGHSKKTALRVFFQHKDMLRGLGNEPLCEEVLKNVEAFICKVYNVPEAVTTDQARVILFKKAVKPELLPPTSDALKYHIKRCHLQTIVWLQATCPVPSLPLATSFGWDLKDGIMSPVLLSLPAVPESCLQLITCGCQTRCSTRKCRCVKSRLTCTGNCRCTAECMNADH